ncbi:MAG: GNAT family N-acetyltransferase [Acidobacteriota bacterium]
MTTIELVRKLERAEADVSLRAAKVCKEHGADMRVRPALGGWAIDFGPGSPLSQVLFAGMEGEVTEEELGEVESAFFARDVATTISLCPYADASLVKILGKRGYRITHFEHTMLRGLDDSDAVVAAPGVRQARREDWTACTDVVCNAFFPEGDAPDSVRNLFEVLFGAEGAGVFLAMQESTIAACAGVTVTGEVAVLAGDGTVPRFRGLGLQNELIRTRCGFARQQGCGLAMSSTVPGSSSQRNYERQGFRVAYTKALLTKEPGTPK